MGGHYRPAHAVTKKLANPTAPAAVRVERPAGPATKAAQPAGGAGISPVSS
jgi:hypothetical protein